MQQKERDPQFITPAQAVPNRYLREPIKDREAFKVALATLVADLDPTDREGANKGCVKTFLESTFWDAEHYKVGEVDDIDLAITDKATGNVVVMFEFKKVGDADMVSVDNLNCKAMHELVLYYLLEESRKLNTNVRHLIITDGYQWFVFEKGDFWKCFGADKSFTGEVLQEEQDPHVRREYIYRQVIKPKVEKVWHRITFTYFDLRKVERQLATPGFIDGRAFAALYKLFTPTHLLGLPFDTHSDISGGFYRELLYIMGLQEVTEARVHRIKRMSEGGRSYGSLVEQVYTLQEDFFPEGGQEGSRFEAALGLVMVWVSRVLFLRLLETQLVNFNDGDRDYEILSKINSFNLLHRLFFNVLAVPEEERTGKVATLFKNVPYLNSSLFELADVEKNYFSVNALGNKPMPVMKGTVLKNREGRTETGNLPVLDYLLRFLDAYDFGSNQGGEGKTLISVAVLGLIFEKINGYQDGSYFTSGEVTAYMCRKVLREAVVAKFNAHFGWQCATFDDLKERFDYGSADNRAVANQLINGIRICDPSVGSGHFLVAALNEFLAVKRELNVLCAADGSRMKAYWIKVEGDELSVANEEGEFQYKPSQPESRKVQETLFEEKRTIIENCLFGVDVNPKSAEICQLRLWIELLKNAYYYKDGKGVRRLQTLPNIDINIKTGNSLIMQQRIDANLNVVLAGAGLTMDKYREDVAAYKKSATKAVKHKMNEDISSIKAKIHKGFTFRSPLYKAWAKAYVDLLNATNDLFPTENPTRRQMELQEKERKLRLRLDGMQHSRILGQSLEWRYEFPEVLDERGNYVGFDVVIGNPPYGVRTDGEYRKRAEDNWGHVPDYEIYYYFIRLAETIVRRNGYVAYIIPNTWLFNVNAQEVRHDLLRHWHILEVLDCTSFSLFDRATVRNTILTMRRYPAPIGDDEAATAQVGYRNTKDLLPQSRAEGNSPLDTLTHRPLLHTDGKSLMSDFSQNWALAFQLTEEEKRIVDKIKSHALPLRGAFPEISQGLIAYDKLKGQSDEVIQSRAYHSHTYKEGYKKWLLGEDVTRYRVKWNGTEYVNYGSGIANPRKPEFFQGRRILIREITNPSIYATITDEELYHDPAVIVVKDNKDYPLELVCGILNSRLGSFFHFRNSPKATKGVFPKILIADINGFPLPKLDTDEKQDLATSIVSLVKQVTAMKAEEKAIPEEERRLERDINQLVCRLYGLSETETDIINQL